MDKARGTSKNSKASFGACSKVAGLPRRYASRNDERGVFRGAPSIVECYGCGALVENIAGQPHKYIGANQGCWDLFGQILAKEFGEYKYPENTHRLTVDTYAIQHPGQPNRQAIQSVNIHLISLYCVFIKGLSGKEATKVMGKVLENSPNFEWLEPPIPNGKMTIIDVLKAKNQTEHEKIVQEWAKDVFGCWYSKHKQAIEKNIIHHFSTERRGYDSCD